MTPRIVAASGAALGAPENTFAAAHAAARAGADMVEVDIRQSRDGVLYLMRDASVVRTTNGTGAVAALDAAAIDRLDAGSRFGPVHAGEPVPRLERFLAALRGSVDFCLVLRGGDTAGLAHLLRAAGLEARCLVRAADPSLDRALARTAPWVVRVADWPGEGGARAARDTGARVLRLPPAAATPERIGEIGATGLDVMLAAGSTEPSQLAPALRSAARYLLTDHPGRAHALRRRSA